eukprot:CAMPEP_0184657820 /NCGR_PEP_ID=MMETSP0308-20130426/21913_1 /TAXON_ID=38269 /ORGANISM="Gloeochaete witrockiana, Strain SAG 46.84" /LENGTH=324 /DNA_ID=CAMNT_0027096129 /DNA_START=50 /DNA_END=1027 /DNA_ORIENTATION=+
METESSESAPDTAREDERQPQQQPMLRVCELSMKLMTFNLLAPCYKRVPTYGGTEMSKWVEADGKFEALRMMRYEKLLDLLRESNADIIFLQEFWFQERIQKMFENYLRKYTFYYHKRPKNKADGLCTLVSSSLRVTDVQNITFHVGDRVAILLRVEQANPQEGGCSDEGVSVLAGNVHLTFPHDSFYRDRRLNEIQAVTTFVDQYIARENLHHLPVLLGGDFNDADDAVCRWMSENRYVSSFHTVHQREPGVTHMNHLEQEVSVDYIFFREPLVNSGWCLRPSDAHLLPRELPDVAWPEGKWNISDHRPLATDFLITSSDSPP